MTFRALVLVSACLGLALPAAAQTEAPASRASAWKAPRNVWGHPDLSGVWTNATITRLERDPRFGDRLVLSEEEARRIEGVARDDGRLHVFLFPGNDRRLTQPLLLRPVEHVEIGGIADDDR